MATLGPEQIADLTSACQAGASEIAQALSRALDAQIEASLGPGGAWDPASQSEGFDGPGLLVTIGVGATAIVAVLPESTGLAPPWCAAPDATGLSKLATLAQELSLLVLPDSIAAGEYRTVRVPSISAALTAAAPAPNAARLAMTLSADQGRQGALSLIWPLQNPRSLLSTPAANSAKNPAPAHASATPPAPRRAAADEGQLPPYTRSLLRIPVPVSVTLAAKRQSVQQVLELVAGSIIHFDKACDGPLDVEVNGHCVAQGEAVKVGDKFGIRVQSVVLPSERFKPIEPA